MSLYVIKTDLESLVDEVNNLSDDEAKLIMLLDKSINIKSKLKSILAKVSLAIKTKELIDKKISETLDSIIKSIDQCHK